MSAVSPFDRNNIELFQPNQVAGLALWLDAADSSTVITSGANVTQWNDKSSNAHICISNANYVGTFLPTYNSNAIYKNVNFADNQALVTSSNWNYSPSWSCFVALNSVSLGARWLISPHNAIPTPVLMSMQSGTNKIFQNAFNSVPVDLTGNHIEYTSAENTSAISNLLWYRDGVLQASNVKNLGGINSSSPLKMGIGANGTLGNNMAGTYQLYEVLIFNSYLSSTQRQQIESYLAYKWNLQSSLPTNHPYYNSPYNVYPPFTNINQITKFAYPVLPNNIGGLALWLDAADVTTITQVNGAVSQWNDKSGNVRHMSQGVVASQPIILSNTLNTLPVISFSNLIANPSTFMSSITTFPVNGLTNMTIYAIANSTSNFSIGDSTGNALIWWNESGGWGQVALTFSQSQYAWRFGTGQSANNPRVNFPTNIGLSYVLLDVTKSGLTETPFYNGNNLGAVTVSNTAIANTSNVPFIGLGVNNNFGRYNIAEILVYSNAITTTQRQQIESYLAYKWGLQTSLPSTHPYYNNFITPTITQSIPNAITLYQFSPRSLSGLSLWLDAADANSVLRTGINVTAWNDKSGNGFNMSNNASYQSPTYNTTGFNGRPTISFVRNSSNNFTILENTSFSFTQNSFSLFFMSQKTGSDAVVYQRFFSAVATIGGQDYNTSNNFNINSGLTNTSIDYEKNGKVIGAFTITNPFLGEVIVNGTGSVIGRYNSLTNYIYANGSQVNASTTPTAGANFNSVHVRLGSATYAPSSNDNNLLSFNGNTSEVIFFNRVLTTIESQAVEGYLAWKWGLQSNLPASHPYKLYPP